MEKEKFQQKALKQTKQKKSKSAEFLMVKEERAATEGIENPAFNISSTDLSAYQPSEEKVIRHDKPDSTLAAHQQKLGLQAHAEPRGNEYSRNYFDPLMDEEINPRRCGMEVSEEDPVKSDEQILYSKLMKLLDEENKMLDFQAAHVVSEDFPESVMPVSSGKACDLHRELEDEEIPSYIEQFERDVQDDIILLGSFSLEQHHKEVSHRKKQKWRARIQELLQRLGSQPLKTEENGREEEMIASFGNLASVNTGLNGAAAGPCEKVDYSKKPQSIEIHFKCLRGVKDKVPKGHYTLKVRVLSRLGGGLLERPELKEQPQARTTQPVTHGGNFYNTEIYFGQSIQTVLPHRKAMKPGMVLLFELFLLRGTYAWIDQEVGWGAFPLCDNNFNALEGKFKCPFLRGHYDPKVDRFKKIENFISQDLDHWLCNLYFQITKLPQDSEKQSKCDMHLHLPPELHMYSSVAEKNDVSEKVVQSGPQGQPLTSPKDPDTHKGSIPTVVEEVEKQFNAAKGGEVCVSEEAWRKREELKMLPAEDYQDCHGSADEHCDLFWPKEVQGGHHEVNWNNPPDQHHEERSGPESNGSQEEEKTSVESNFYLEELEQYTFSVGCHSAAEVKLYRQVVEHFHFVAYTVFSELGATHWRSRDFWLLALLVVLLWFVRLYLHYLSQWLFLQTISVPVTKLHSEGWLLDVFRRIHGEEGAFFIPLDLEISSQELNYIMKRAEQWRGINGERRMVAVSDYIWKDHASQPGVSSCDLQHQDEIPDSAASLKGSTTVHVSVYTVHLSGLRELYRHFLRLPDGAIIEAFGDISEESLLCNEMNTTQEPISKMDNVLCTSTLIKLREKKKSTARWEGNPVVSDKS
ncbi:uncharacterized protein LOC114000632 isoform X4 [Pipra filicauda]|uniref:Uncharacterized protein LOC114000632 isoform X4 n=1 Tax=Pipra filicauda TaxID=649802 RepID=A0A7R5L1E7_9PASS|nr:uncharacterized protein LOC114000632 isoform X4 [Pipra filicauda]